MWFLCMFNCLYKTNLFLEAFQYYRLQHNVCYFPIILLEFICIVDRSIFCCN